MSTQYVLKEFGFGSGVSGDFAVNILRMAEEIVKLRQQNDVLKRKLERAVKYVEESVVAHIHEADLPYTRALGSSYGWCDYCGTKVSWGECDAALVLKEINRICAE